MLQLSDLSTQHRQTFPPQCRFSEREHGRKKTKKKKTCLPKHKRACRHPATACQQNYMPYFELRGVCIWLRQWHITREVWSFARYYILFRPYRRKTPRLNCGLGSCVWSEGENHPFFFVMLKIQCISRSMQSCCKDAEGRVLLRFHQTSKLCNTYCHTLYWFLRNCIWTCWKKKHIYFG